MAEAVNVLILLQGPVLGHIGHANLLALVEEGRARLEAEENCNQLGARDTMLGIIMDEAADRSRLVVVLQIQGVPALVVVHELLPLVGGGLKL